MRKAGIRNLTILALVFVCHSHALAETDETLSGRVTDPRGGSVAGSVVTLYTRDTIMRMSVTTDATGSYRFERVAPGDYVLQVRATGFATSTVQSVRIEDGRPARLDIPLQLAGVHEEIVVTAAGAPQPIAEVSKAISTVSHQEIEERDEYSIPEALRAIPGLRVQQLGGPGALASIKMRGLRSEDTALLIDGMRFRDAASTQADASAFLADMIVTDVDRVEILRGSGSSLYGSNAIGGVINVVTDEGGGRARGSLLLEGGSLGLFRGRGQFAGGARGDRVSYSAGLAHVNVSNGVDKDDPARNTSGQGSLSLRLSSTATLSARLYAVDSFVKLNTSPQGIGALPAIGIIQAVPLSSSELRRFESGTPAGQLNIGSATFIPAANNPDWTRSGRFVAGLITLAQRLNETFGYTVAYQGLATNRTFRDGPAGVSFQPTGITQSDFDGRIATLSARVNLRSQRLNSVDAGYEFENENFVNRSFPVRATDNSSVDVTQRSHAIFLQDQLRLFDNRLQLSAAFRAQYFTLKNPKFVPSESAPYTGFQFEAPPNAYTADASIAYFIRKTGTKLRGHMGNGYRAPSLFERFGTFFGSFGYSTFGDPRLHPDRSIAFDVGLDQDFFEKRVRTAVTYFYTRLQEIIIFDFSGVITPATDPFGRFGGYRNTNGGLARGLELSLTLTPKSSVDLSLAYTHTNADQRTPLVADIIRTFIIPNHQFSLVATQRIGRRFFVNFDLTASSNYLAPVFNPQTFASRAYRFDGIAKADLGASYTVPLSDFRAIRFFGKVDNIFDCTYFENGFRTPGATALGGMRFEF